MSGIATFLLFYSILKKKEQVAAETHSVRLVSMLMTCLVLSELQDALSASKEEILYKIQPSCHLTPVKVEICPYYDGNNYDFFFDNVFVDLEEIASSVHSKRDVFVKQVLNTNFFGKLTILPNGDVYANLNRESLGNLKEHSLNELVYKEIEHGNTWLNTRNEGTCAQCIYNLYISYSKSRTS